MRRPSTILISAVIAAVLAGPALAMAAGADVDWGVTDFVLAGLLVAGAGLALEGLARRPRAVAPRAAIGIAGLSAVAVGELDDAPGLVGFGLLLVLAATGSAAWHARRARSDRSAA